MLTGVLFACIAGALVGLQNIFNSKVNEHTGIWVTTTLVLGLGFVASFVMGIIFEGSSLFHLQDAELWFWFSGIIGVGVVVSIVKGIKRLGPTFAISIVMISQLSFALMFDTFGWLGLEKVPFTPKQLIGVIVIILGIILFKIGSWAPLKVSKEK